jgi:hypothetical protein
MRLRLVILAGGAIFLSLAGVPAAANGSSPSALYRALLRSPFPESQLPAGLSSPRTSARKQIATNARRHHVIGEVEIDLNKGQAGIVYAVFPTRRDARGNYEDALRALNGLPEIKSQLPAPNLPQPAVILSGSQSGVRFTTVAFVSGNLGITTTATNYLSKSKSANELAALGLARAALRHLNVVKRQSAR